MNIYILRHGETNGNKAGRIQGSTDIPLNEYGIELAKITRDGIEKEGLQFDIIYARVMCLVALSILIGVIGVGTFWIRASPCSAYFSLVRLINSSKVEPLKPLEFQVGITGFLSRQHHLRNKFFPYRRG